MNYLLFALYFIILSWLLLRSSFIKKAELGQARVLVLFFLKIMAGITIGWLSIHYYKGGNDYWDLNREAWKEYQLLWSQPGEYFSNIFRSDYPQGYTGVFASFQSYWNDLENNLIIKLVSLFNIFSRGNYYINSLFFNYIIFFGHVALYRVFIKIYNGQMLKVIIGCFLLPSLLYFSSGIHKDGLVFLLLALLIFAISTSLEQSFKLKRLLLIVLSLALIFLLRNFVFLALLPAAVAWIIAAKMKWPAILPFLVVYGLSALLFFGISRFVPSIDPPQAIVQKQMDFMQLPASSTAIQLDSLRPDPGSFLRNVPQSFNHLLLRPYLTELPSKILLPMNIELLLYQLMFILLIFFRRKREGPPAVFTLFALFFTLTAFLFIGYIVPNIGSLLRYRSLYLPFIITPLICNINWEKIGRLIKIIK